MGISTARVLELTTSVTAFEKVAALAARRAQALDESGGPPVEKICRGIRLWPSKDRRWSVRAAFRSKALSFENSFSIGLKSGL